MRYVSNPDLWEGRGQLVKSAQGGLVYAAHEATVCHTGAVRPAPLQAAAFCECATAVLGQISKGFKCWGMCCRFSGSAGFTLKGDEAVTKMEGSESI